MPDRVKVERALLSVSDKTALVDFARALADLDIELVSTGGTARALESAGLRVTTVESLTGFPEMMDGRLKTLHPAVHGGILALRDHPEHQRAMRQHAIAPIDLVCINLYPFEDTIANPDASRDEAIENIDVGGPAMIRAAAKNHQWVAVVTSPAQYADLIQELRTNNGAIAYATRARLAARAFDRTASYDRAIGEFLGATTESGATSESGATACPAALSGQAVRQPSPGAPDFPPTLSLHLRKHADLRYGENPHQSAAVYLDPTHRGPSVITAKQLHGKELSYNNLNDAAAALALALELAALDPAASAAVIIKHANPCGAALASTARDAADLALRGDPIAAYGGILAIAAPLDLEAARVIATPNSFLEVVIAPAFTDDALETLRARSTNVRLLRYVHASPPQSASSTMPTDLGGTGVSPVPTPSTPCIVLGVPTETPSEAAPARPLSLRSIPGGALVQSADTRTAAPHAWLHRAGPPADAERLRDAAAVWTIAKHLSSNAVAIGGREPPSQGIRLFGAGAGQMDRVTACRLAVEKAGPLAKGAIAASDAFFPFPDGPELLINAGVTTIVHPGGSKRDQETFDLCNAHNVTCLTTGVRHFRH